MNPYTPLRQQLGRMRAELEEMYQDALSRERAFQGEPAAVLVEAAPTPRRGRKPRLEAPPPATLGPTWTAQPDPDGDALPESPASPERASSRPRETRMVPANLNQFGVPRKGKVKPWEAEKNFD
jgi:hypothetical protein